MGGQWDCWVITAHQTKEPNESISQSMVAKGLVAHQGRLVELEDGPIAEALFQSITGEWYDA